MRIPLWNGFWLICGLRERHGHKMKERLDILLVRQGFAPSREKAKAIIMTGNVYVNGQREDKAGAAFETEKAQIEVRGA